MSAAAVSLHSNESTVAATPQLSKPHPGHPLLPSTGQQVSSHCVIGGVETNLIVTSFSDRIFVAVTQTDKLGSITMAATHKSPTATALEAPSFSLTTLLGVRNASLPSLLARRLIESVSASKLEHMASKPILLSLGLKKPLKSSNDNDVGVISQEDMTIVRELMAHIEAIKQW